MGIDNPSLSPLYLPYRTGGTFYYHTPVEAFSSLILVQNTLYSHPYFVPMDTTFSGIAVMTSGVASASARLGIYNDGGGVPGTLRLDANTVATATAGLKSIAISHFLPRGVYWLGAAVQGAAGSLWCTGVNGGQGIIGSSGFGTTGPVNGFSQTGISGALPSPWGATLTQLARVPLVLLAPA